MLPTKPAGTSATYTLASATTEIMWACAFATARATVASTAHSLGLWSHMLRPLTDRPDRPIPPPVSNAAAERRQPSGAATPAGPIPFASYRTSGGHASAQVIVPD